METPANPALSLVDLDAIGAISGPITVVDSTFAGPTVQRPLDHGVDLVLHAATKGIAGHNDALLGRRGRQRRPHRPDLGVAVGHGRAGVAVRRVERASAGIRTLGVRSRQQAETALELATFLEGHDAIESVSYPHLDSHPQHDLAKRQMQTGGTVVTFEVAGGADAHHRRSSSAAAWPASRCRSAAPRRSSPTPPPSPAATRPPSAPSSASPTASSACP